MIFTAYEDERKIINRIQSIRNEEYALIRLTSTMIDKNNIDANEIFRELLKNTGIVDYEELGYGGANGILENVLFIHDTEIDYINMKFYRVQNKRGDRRFSIETIKRKTKEKTLNEGDLLYISAYYTDRGFPQLFMVNLTTNPPGTATLLDAIDKDEISKKIEEIKPILHKIINAGFVNNVKGIGAKSPKDVGDTFESLLDIETNNRVDADIDGLIEVKTKGETKTLDTLFTLRPSFDGTEVSRYEKNDRRRVSAFARLYGYDSDKHPGYSSLYITIGSKESPKNNQGFFLEVNDSAGVVNLCRTNGNTGKDEITAYWHFDDLKARLNEKHPSTLWVKAIERIDGNMYQFKYTDIEFSRAPQFTTFLSLIKEGIITYDWRGYTTKTGNYAGKNHGNAWRIKPEYKDYLFGEIEHLMV